MLRMFTSISVTARGTDSQVREARGTQRDFWRMRGRISRSSVPCKWEPEDTFRRRLPVPAAAPEQTTHVASSAKEVDAGQAHHRGTRRGEGGANIPAEQPELPQGPPLLPHPHPRQGHLAPRRAKFGEGVFRPLVPQSQKDPLEVVRVKLHSEYKRLGGNLSPSGEVKILLVKS